MNDRLSAHWERIDAQKREQARQQARPNAIAVAADALAAEGLVREGFADKARRYLRRLPLGAEAVAMYFCLLDEKTPGWVKAVAAAALAYFILPFDGVPDLLPAIGLTDDASILAAAFAAIAAWVTAEHRTLARDWMNAEDLGRAPGR